jgi:hypothetical protein
LRLLISNQRLCLRPEAQPQEEEVFRSDKPEKL